MRWILRALGRVPVRRWEQTPVRVEPYGWNEPALPMLLRVIQTINVTHGRTLLVLRNPHPSDYSALDNAIAILPVDRQVAPVTTLVTEDVARGRIKSATVYVSTRAIRIGDFTDGHLYDALKMALGSSPRARLRSIYP